MLTPATEWTVSQLNQAIQEAIRRDPRMKSLDVRGEISGFKHHIASGHWYFSLKDAQSSVKCVMFRQNALRVRLLPRDGMSVVVSGYVDVFPRDGQVQLYVTDMREAGVGDLYQRFEALKRRLMAEGLFDPARKRPLPMAPRKVAVVTSASGAALHDILNVSRLRSPAIPIVLVPVTVQGAGAAEEIAAGIRRANGCTDASVIIVGRGGGSPEDLWCFNEEIVARAVAASRLPVVSGVGHEIDTTICDLAADVRASTPSNAAEIVFPDRKELSQRMAVLRAGLLRAVGGQMQARQLALAQARQRLGALSPERRIALLVSSGALAREGLSRAMARYLEARAFDLRWARTSLIGAGQRRLDGAAADLRACRERLDAISPLQVLSRGYAIVYNPRDQVIPTAAEAEKEQEYILRFADGRVRATRREAGYGGDGAEL